MQKKIWIDISFSFKRKTGIGAYILTLFNIFEKQNISYQAVELMLPDKMKYKSIFQIIWQNTILYFLTLLLKPDIFISPAFICPIFTRKKTKYITVIHDLAFFINNLKSKNLEIILCWATQNAIKKSDLIVTVSETIKNEIIQRFKIPSNRIKVVHNAIADYFINYEENIDVLKKYNIQKDKYILSVATLAKHKNIPELIKAYKQINQKHPDLKLVLVGKMNDEDKTKLKKSDNIIFTGYIPDSEIPTLYNNALLYVFPSLYEGFGTPIVEAQYSGIPLICSDIPVFREIAGKGAEFCKPDSIDIENKINYLINNLEERNKLIQLGKENVKRFNIEKITEQLKEVIND